MKTQNIKKLKAAVENIKDSYNDVEGVMNNEGVLDKTLSGATGDLIDVGHDIERVIDKEEKMNTSKLTIELTSDDLFLLVAGLEMLLAQHEDDPSPWFHRGEARRLINLIEKSERRRNNELTRTDSRIV